MGANNSKPALIATKRRSPSKKTTSSYDDYDQKHTTDTLTTATTSIHSNRNSIVAESPAITPARQSCELSVGSSTFASSALFSVASASTASSIRSSNTYKDEHLRATTANSTAVFLSRASTCETRGDLHGALQWYERAIAATVDSHHAEAAEAQYRAALILVQQQSPKKAFQYFMLAAAKAHPEAQYIVGAHFERGVVVKEARRRDAKAWYERAAKQGHAQAQAALASILLEDNDPRSAIVWFLLAADQNHTKALLRLGSLYEKGECITQDIDRALACYQKVITIALPQHENNTPSSSAFWWSHHSDDAAGSYAVAHYIIGINYRLGDLGLTKNPERAFHHMTVAANAGYAAAQRVLGLMYCERNDDAHAHTLFTSAALQGDLRAVGLLAQQYELGRGCVIDRRRAIELYTKAAEAGSIPAQRSLAELYHRLGRTQEANRWFETVTRATPKQQDKEHVLAARLMLARYKLKSDPEAAFEELIQLADIEYHVDSYYWVAAYYEEKRCDLDQALIYYEKGAGQGDTECAFQVALILSNNGRPQDRERAFVWYERAAEQGHRTAQYSLALYYAKGLAPVTAPQIDMARQWGERAALQELPCAMVLLAQLMLQQQGQEQEALYWLRKAAAKGEVSAMRELAAAYESGAASAFIQQDDPDARYKTAFQLLDRAAVEKKDPLAWCAKARYFENGWATEADLSEAVACYTKAVSLGYAKASLHLADMYIRQSMWHEARTTYDAVIDRHSIRTALGWEARLAVGRLVVFKCSEIKDARVHGWLCDMVDQEGLNPMRRIEPYEMLGACCEYARGGVDESDLTSASTWYSLAVKIETPTQDWIQERARFRLAVIAMVRRQYSAALQYLRALEPLLPKMNHVSPETRQLARHVRFHLGELLYDQAPAEAGRWLGEAADEGDGRAAYMLGQVLQGTDDKEAKHRYNQGISAGHAGCMRAYAILLEKEHQEDDTQCNTDRREAIEWLEQAAQLGDIEALVHLGLLYETEIRAPMQALPLYIAAGQRYHIGAMVKAAQIYAKLGRYQDAVLWLQRASPESRMARVLLASYRMQGRGGLPQDDEAGLAELLYMIRYEKQEAEESSEDTNAMGLAHFLAGQCYELGRGIDKDLVEAQMHYKRAAQGTQHTDAMVRLGTLLILDNSYQDALSWFHRAAEAKHPHSEAQYQIGLMHRFGHGGLDVNPVAARKYFGKASDQGHARAKYELARILWAQGEYQEAYHLYDVAAKLGVPEAMRELGNLFHQGTSANDSTSHDTADASGNDLPGRDRKRAFQCYCDAAELGDATAALMVGTYFEEDDDIDQALQWYDVSRRLGEPLATLALGRLKHTMADNLSYDGGQEERTDALRQEAYTLFCACTDNHAKVMVALYHLNGWGHIERDPTYGFQLLLELAEAGVSEVFVHVAKCYEDGVGVSPDLAQALVYWELAAAMDDVDALIRVGEFKENGLAGQVDSAAASRSYSRARAISKAKGQNITACSSSSSSIYSNSAPSSYSSRRNSLHASL
ncbi:hypothetical protein BCR43DRAFT_518094 [Syncephalastrum racemosum]|uniref:Sel1 repeat protein n=1 Tax=Syncephalastrum racemosum TaxID=13706 RepID=A0A1X2H2T8_SYNRA|nr:hypothetical protein BCR43DRAFT_518094 [Syncephalastrum racemosum]